MRTKRKICIITGTRAEYGLLKPLMRSIIENPSLTLQTIVTGMHLSALFGETEKVIIQDGFVIDAKVKMTPSQDSNTAMAISVGEGIIGMTNVLQKLKPDIVVVLGDRVEALAGAVSAAFSNIPVAHIHGGDVTRGGLDEISRHAITKISHIHFPATKKSAERIIKMGEEPWRVHIVGAPGLDGISPFIHSTVPNKFIKKYKLGAFKPMLLVVQHPVTTQTSQAESQMKATLNAVKELRFQTIIVYPNSDAGSRSMIKIIESFRKKFPFIQVYKSIPRSDYLWLLRKVSALVGNSSSGIIESPSFHLPVVDIGIRQEGREKSINTIHVEHRTSDIIKAVNACIHDKDFRKRVEKCTNPYKLGNTAKTMGNILSSIIINEKLLQKKLAL